MKFIDETFVITIFENGTFCWKTEWRNKRDHERSGDITATLICVLLLVGWLS